MKSLEESRAAIDAVDREIVRLFEERMKLCREVAKYKIANGLQVLDRSREEKVLASRAAMLKDPYWADSVRTLFEGVMALSRAEQEKLLKGEGEG
ncbi:MAG: chorismate mutase [Aristaeellaceae bacterium]